MEVYALVGPSGTGKSHRASLIAHDYEVDLIIDDGLLIGDTKILEGRSAKREGTRVAAVRRAMFFDCDHAARARERIRQLQPRRVLVLGTSRNMIKRILSALELGEPIRYISIDDIASADEIRRAMRVRREQGKHVIPAPTFEVKRTFSGYLVDPLRLRLFGRGRSFPPATLDVEKSIVRPTFSSLGQYSINDMVVVSIVRHTARQVAGVVRVSRVGVDGNEAGVVLRLDTILQYGEFLPDIAEELQARVKESVEYMTALNVLAVEVTVVRLASQ